MKKLRATLRLGLFALWTAVLYLLFLVVRLFLLPFQSAALRHQAFTFRHWARGTATILGMRIRVEGDPPRPPFFLVSNHLSYMDVIVLATQLDAFFVSKSEVASWPIMGRLAKSMNTIFVDRERRNDVSRVLDKMQDVLRSGHGVVFFPEGTSSKGEGVLRFKASLFDAPIRMGYPVYCASLSYKVPESESAADLSVCWWGDMEFMPHFWELLQLSRFQARVVFGEGVEHHEDRREFADASRAIVERHFVPVLTRAEA